MKALEWYHMNTLNIATESGESTGFAVHTTHNRKVTVPYSTDPSLGSSLIQRYAKAMGWSVAKAQAVVDKQVRQLNRGKKGRKS